MKKLSLLILFCTFACSALYAATVQRAILSHQGKLTQYDVNHWADAISDAVAGDTVYFTQGYFSGNLIITKPICLIGAGVSKDDIFWKNTNAAAIYEGCSTTGESTKIDGDVSIAIPGSLTLTRTLMEGFSILNHWTTVDQPITNLVLKRCQFGNFVANAKLTNLTLESCYLYSLNCNNFENSDVHNCIIENLENSVELEFLNCITVDLHFCVNSSFVNCGFCALFDSGYCTFVNCLYRDTDVNSTYVNCTYVYESQLLTKSDMLSNNYLGTDGTVIGPLGGPAPFTLIPSQPYVSASTLNYNKSTKKLTVNVTVNKGK